MKKRKAFTLIELIIVITILSILSTIGFLSYSSTLGEARNSTRISDMANIKMSLKNHKLKNGYYPNPAGNTIEITNSGTIIKQGFLNNDVATQEIVKKPQDPLVKIYYPYSISANKLFFQVAMSMEDNSVMKNAFVDGDFQTPAPDLIVGLVFASKLGGTIQSLSGKTILDKGTYNLPYDENGNIVSAGVSFSTLTSQNGVTIPKFCGYYSCQEIYENAMSYGSGTYCILDNTGNLTSTGCPMNY